VATTTADAVLLWAVATGELIGRLPQRYPSFCQFAPGDRFLAFDNTTGEALVWHLSPERLSVDELRLRAEGFSGSHFDETGAYVPLSEEAYRVRWQQLSKRPEHLHPSPSQTYDWHWRRVDAAEVDKAWATAIEHLDRLIALEPQRSRLFVRRGVDHHLAKQWDKAIADLTRAIALGAEDPWIWQQRGEAYARMGQRPQAEADFQEAKRRGWQPPK
jgi:tetratricopeptide (TPR) repeat protein